MSGIESVMREVKDETSSEAGWREEVRARLRDVLTYTTCTTARPQDLQDSARILLIFFY
jgi:hypothetical protein